MGNRSKHTWVIDVIEEGSASIEIDGRIVTPVPAWMLPAGAREGDVLSVSHTRKDAKSTLVIEIDADAKEKSLARSAKQVRGTGRNDRGGDIKL